MLPRVAEHSSSRSCVHAGMARARNGRARIVLDAHAAVRQCPQRASEREVAGRAVQVYAVVGSGTNLIRPRVEWPAAAKAVSEMRGIRPSSRPHASERLRSLSVARRTWITVRTK